MKIKNIEILLKLTSRGIGSVIKSGIIAAESQNSNLLMNSIAKISKKIVFSFKKVILHQIWSFGK